MREYVIGERVESDGNRATILFIGEVPPTKGTWLGVEWDDPKRGRHSGCHDGIQYFSTRKQNAGSFIRVNKIDPCLKFSQALSERYLKNSTDGFIDEELISTTKDEMNAPFLQLVGLEKIGRQQSKLNELKIAVLDHMRINCTENNLGDVCPNLEELNVSSNLFTSWVQIADVAKQLVRLSVLDVSDNKLSIPDDCRSLATSFLKLKFLTMSQMDYTWKDVVTCSAMWPGVEHLSVPNNKIRCLEFMDSDVFSELKVLNLEGNQIEHWEEVNKLGQLPNLEQLSLYGTGLQDIQVKENSFPKLQKLSLSNNKISQWQHVSELDKMALLKDLKIFGNPDLRANSYETFLQWVIARVGNLQVVNGTSISGEDRRGAELDYLKYHGREYILAMEDQRLLQSFLANHPRYYRLVERYGPPERSECETKSMTLKSSLITLSLVYCSKTFMKKLPSTMEVQKLKTLCHRLFNLDSSGLVLYLTSAENPDFSIPMDNDLRPISFYSVEDGDTIIVKDC